MRYRITGYLKNKSAAPHLIQAYLATMNDSQFAINNSLFVNHYLIIGINTEPMNYHEDLAITITLTPCDMACYRHVDFCEWRDMLHDLAVEEMKD